MKKVGLEPISDEYNVIYRLIGKSQESLVVIGHMDTVSGTVGADDNASGAAGVLELLRVVQDIFKNKKPQKTLYFVISADEEVGLKGAEHFVERMKDKDLAKFIEFAIITH